MQPRRGRSNYRPSSWKDAFLPIELCHSFPRKGHFLFQCSCIPRARFLLLLEDGFPGDSFPGVDYQGRVTLGNCFACSLNICAHLNVMYCMHINCCKLAFSLYYCRFKCTLSCHDGLLCNPSNPGT